MLMGWHIRVKLYDYISELCIRRILSSPFTNTLIRITHIRGAQAHTLHMYVCPQHAHNKFNAKTTLNY